MSTGTASSSQLRQISKLWFASEMVVIKAGDCVFRVLAATLKRKSSVFADMFALAQPSSPQNETMDGVPLVTVYDDPVEMEVFLQAIYDSDFFMPPPAETTFEECLGILRLAHKYDVPYLRRRALQHLQSMLPTSVAELDRRDQPGRRNLENLVATISIATEVGAQWLLPMAYFLLHAKYKLSFIIKQPQWLALGDEQRTASICGPAELSQQAHKVFSFLSVAKTPGDEECADSKECNRSRLSTAKRLNPWISAHMNSALYAFPAKSWSTISLCESCLEEAKNLHAAAKQECWGQIPMIFGLPPWDELEKMRSEALSQP
ncbi:BTB domain-containing protein [Favolaschia claudopus]|uniref:BTB domain-containing protein n=1 Tax=Favolaschia claudopus TaxID=2862362 RepID=A0AAW0AIA9_9AGAR